MHERFRYRNKEELLQKASLLGLDLPYSDDISSLSDKISLGKFTIPNRLAVQPMEGYDSMPDGSPSELTRRRYLRYAAGGSGMIWFEAVAVSQDGRSNPRQLYINSSNAHAFAKLIDEVRETAAANGNNPLLVIQLTHSGRYSKPDGHPHPLAAAPNRVLDRTEPHILTDNELARIRDNYIEAAGYSALAGFDAIDLKACHGYLVIDLLAARSRKNSRYGGEPSTARFRFMLETLDIMKTAVPGMMLTSRVNATDLYENGFGVNADNDPDYSEVTELVAELEKRDISLVNISMGSPYHNPHVTRPYDTPVPGTPVPEEHPMTGIMRMISATSMLQHMFPRIRFVGSAYSWLRQFAPNTAAGVVKSGGAAFVGLGRSSFAYPSMPSDLFRYGKADPEKVCITCSGCTRLIRAFRPGGCVIRDREIYGAELKKLVADEKRKHTDR